MMDHQKREGCSYPWREHWCITMLLGSAAALLNSTPSHAKPSVSASGANYAIATVQPIATDAGMQVFRAGGNAVDAAVCAALTLGVVDNHNSGLGGGCLILVRSPEGEFFAIDGRETAPAKATHDMFLRDGVAVPELSRAGPLAVGTPGALAAYALLLERAGTKPLSELLQPGIRAARDGFPIDSNYAQRLSGAAELLSQDPGAKGQLLAEDGSPHPAGTVLRQEDLAETYKQIAVHGPDWFYRGELAKSVGEWMKTNGGVLTVKDFSQYRAKCRKPIVTRYRGHTVVGFPPPSSGGVHVAQILQMLERFDLTDRLKQDRVQTVHLISEAMKLAFADRAHWLGDSDFAEVPRKLINQDYVDSLADQIQPDRIAAVASHGVPDGWQEDLFGRHTTHLAAADAEGWWVAITATVNTGFGAKIIVPGTGLVLNNEMDDFAAAPGVPNVFGLVGSENNSVRPGKRPLSSMSPTIVLDPTGEPLFTVGAAGGPRIISQVLLATLHVIDGRHSLESAISQPRWHHQWRPDQIGVEATFDSEVAAALQKMGHKVETLTAGGVSQGVERLADGRLMAVRDPRVPGKAAAE